MAQLGIQVHGGMGYVEETGAALRALVDDWRAVVAGLVAADAPDFGAMASCLTEALDALGEATGWLLAEGRAPEDTLAVATPYLRLFGLAAGGALLARGALAAHRLRGEGADAPALRARIATARFFAENLAVAARGLARTVTGSAGSLRLDADLLSA